MAIRVLYIHLIGAFGGSSRSLFEAIRALQKNEVEAYFVTQRGSVSKFFGQVATDIVETSGLTQFDNTRYSYYRGVRWLVALREILYLPGTIAALFEAKRRWKHVDLIHLNEFTGLIPMLVARWLFDAPAVVHVRSLARNDRSLQTRWVNSVLKRKTTAVISIDENVRASLPEDLFVEVIHNAFTPAVESAMDVVLDARLKSLRPRSYKVGFVGNLLRVKGLYDLIEAARLLKQSGADVEFIIIGDNARKLQGLYGNFLKTLGLAQDVKADLEHLIQEYDLAGYFHMMGSTTDIQRVYQNLDLLCFPSHYDAPGRPIFEAAFSGIPSVVAVHEPKPDTLVHGVTGLAVPPRDPAKLADALSFLVNNRDVSVEYGEAARKMAIENFDAKRNSEQLLAVYRRCANCANREEKTGRT